MEAVEQNSPPKQREKKNRYTSTVSRLAFTYRRLHISAHKHYSAQCSTTIPRFRIPPLVFESQQDCRNLFSYFGQIAITLSLFSAVSTMLFCGQSNYLCHRNSFRLYRLFYPPLFFIIGKHSTVLFLIYLYI